MQYGGPQCKKMAWFRWNSPKQHLIRVIQWYIYTDHIGYNDQSIIHNLA